MVFYLLNLLQEILSVMLDLLVLPCQRTQLSYKNGNHVTTFRISGESLCLKQPFALVSFFVMYVVHCDGFP